MLLGALLNYRQRRFRPRNFCGQRALRRFAGGKTSSLVVGGRDGLPPQPGDLLPSPLYVANDANTAVTGTKATGYNQFSDLSLLGSRDRRLDRYTLLPNSKCS